MRFHSSLTKNGSDSREIAPLLVAARHVIAVAFFVFCVCVPAWAHIGPPYPIMQNRKVGPFNVEVWSNPDVGTGSFYIIVDPPKGSGLSVPQNMKVQVSVQPESKRLPVATYNTWREKLLDHVEFKTLVPFDKQEMWRVRVLLSSREVTGETDTEVPVTPTLLGRWNLLLFLLPFLAIAALWLKAMRTTRKRRKRQLLKKAQAGASR